MCSITADEGLRAVDAALDALAAVDLDTCSDADLLDRARALVAVQNRLAAELTRVVRKAEVRQAAEHDGLKTMQSWLRTHTRLCGAAAGRLTRRGRALDALPAVQAAFAAGLITADQVDVLGPVTRPEHLDRAAAQHIDLPEIEQALVTVAVTRPHADLQTVVATYLARLDPDGREPDPTEERAVTLAQHPDGAYTLGGTLDAVGGERVVIALESLAAATRCAGDDRSRAQRLGDALVQLCDLALASGQLPILRTVKPQVLVMIDHADLADPHCGHGAGTTGTGAVISAARARWIACDSTVARIVVGPDSMPTDLGRTHRVVPPHLRRGLDARDQGCVFTGCSAPTWWCDAHHLLEWIMGGETTMENLALLCERHHTKVHHGFRVERQPDGRWRTYRPDGTEILTHPPLAAA
jgi:hypothetical protein